MCGHGEHHGFHGHTCWCGCYDFGFRMHFGPGIHFTRRFSTKEERIAWLEEYLKELKAEVKAVEERLAEIRAAK